MSPVGDDVHAAGERISAFEAKVREAARARVGTDLARIQAQFRAEVTMAQGDHRRLTEARKRAARDLRALRPALSPTLRGYVDEGVRLGAAIAGGTVPEGINPGRDHGLKVTLLKANTPVRRHARQSAHAVERMPLNTAKQLEDVIDRIGAVLSEVDAAAGVVASRAVDIGTTAALTERGVGRMWVTRSGCCPVCASYSGSIAMPGEGFQPRAWYGDHTAQWAGTTGGIVGPSAHSHCKCYCVEADVLVANRMARATEADVAAGRIAASMPARIRAIQRMLAPGRRLTQRTRERAQRAAARGRVGGQRPSRDNTRSQIA